MSMFFKWDPEPCDVQLGCMLADDLRKYVGDGLVDMTMTIDPATDRHSLEYFLARVVVNARLEGALETQREWVEHQRTQQQSWDRFAAAAVGPLASSYPRETAERAAEFADALMLERQARVVKKGADVSKKGAAGT